MKYYPASKGFGKVFLDARRIVTLDLPKITPGNIEIDIFSIKDASDVLVHSVDLENPNIEKIPVTDIECELLCDEASQGKGVDTLIVKNKLTSNKFKIVIENKSARSKHIYVIAKYISGQKILSKEIPLAFFRQTLDAMWNKVQPPPITELGIDQNMFYLTWEKMFKEALELPDIRETFEHGSLTIRDLECTGIKFSMETGKLPKPNIAVNKVPVLTINASFEDEGTEIRYETPVKTFEVDLKKIAMKISFYLTEQANLISYVPIVTVSSTVDITTVPTSLGDGTVDDLIDSMVKYGIEKALGKNEYVMQFGKKVTPWMLGGLFNVWSVTAKDDLMIIEYVEPKQKKEDELTPLQPSPAIRTTKGSLDKIKHFVVLMMENRSFDQMLGYLSLETRTGELPENANVNGLKRSEFDRWANPYNGKLYPPTRLEDPHVLQSPYHGYNSVREQKANNMKGFVMDFANIPGNPDKPGVVMGYYDGGMLKVYKQLADEYLVCDRWYCSIPGGTWPNRFITLTGRLNTKPDGAADYDNPSLSSFYPVGSETLFDHLTEKKVSWKYFEHGYCFLRLFSKYTYDMENIIGAEDKEKGFFISAKEGKLPSVTFVDPDFIEYPPGNDDHAPSDPAAGQDLIGRVVNALKSNEDAWKETMLIITYDEHGGFFDHVNPAEDEPAPMISGTLNEYGIRVPTIIVSPWVKKGGYSHELFDHTSIAATILRRFCSPKPPDMGPRTNTANDLRSVIEEEVREDIPNVVLPPFEASKDVNQKLPKASKKNNEQKPEDDFHELLLLASMFGRAPK